MQAVDPDHAAERVDVDEHRVGVEESLQRQVDDADLRAAEQDPGDGEEDARDDERDHREGEEKALERRVGALVHPREQRANAERQRRRAGGEAKRVAEEEPRVGGTVGFAIVAEGEHGRLGGTLRREETLPQQESKRHHAQIQREHHASRDDQPLRVEPGRRRGENRRCLASRLHDPPRARRSVIWNEGLCTGTAAKI